MQKRANNNPEYTASKALPNLTIPTTLFQSGAWTEFELRAEDSGSDPRAWGMLLIGVWNQIAASPNCQIKNCARTLSRILRADNETVCKIIDAACDLGLLIRPDANSISSEMLIEQFRKFNGKLLALSEAGKKSASTRVQHMLKKRSNKRSTKDSTLNLLINELIPSSDLDPRKPYPSPDSKCLLSPAQIQRGLVLFGEAEFQALAEELSDSGKAGNYKDHLRTIQNWRKMKHARGQRFWVCPEAGMGPGYYPMYQVERWKAEGHGNAR